MNKKFVILLALIFSATAFLDAQTTYQTFDVGGGVIEWSTDGGNTNCNCSPNNTNEDDTVLVNHPYTFNGAWWGIFPVDFDGPVYIRTALVGTVLFEDKVTFKNIFEISNSNVVFEGQFVLENAAFASIENASSVEFQRGVDGTVFFFDYGVLSVTNSSVTLFEGTRIEEIIFLVGNGTNISVRDGVDFKLCDIVIESNAVFTLANNVSFNSGIVLSSKTQNLDFGTNTEFTNGAIINFMTANSINTIGGTVRFEKSIINLDVGSEVTLQSGVEVKECVVTIQEGAILNVQDANFNVPNFSPSPIIQILGTLNAFGSTNITDMDMIIHSNGILDLTNSTSCNFNNSKVNDRDAEDILTCGQAYAPDISLINIWDGTSWSQGSPPNNVGIYAEINADYFTESEGSFLCGHLTILNNTTLQIGSFNYVEITQELVNTGLIVIEDKGALLMDEFMRYYSHSGDIKVKVKGNLDEMLFNIWSTPIANPEQNDLLTIFPSTNPCDMYVFEGNSQTWKFDFAEGTRVTCNGVDVVFGPNDIVNGANGKMNPGYGYFIPGNDSSITREFNGVVNNGEVVATVRTTNLGSVPDKWDGDDWNLIGNPYPSGLDLNDFWTRNAVNRGYLTDGLYFWIETEQPPFDEFGSYLVWNPSGGTYSPLYRNEVSVSPTGEGFWVVANDPDGSGTYSYNVEFQNSMRTSMSNTGLLSTRYQVTESKRQRMWINLTNDSNHYDQILIATHPLATDGIDLLYDAHKNYGGEPFGLASVNGNETFTIQGYAPRIAVDTSRVELRVLASNTSNHYLSIDSSAYYLDDKRVFLVDVLKGTEREMLEGDSLLLDIDTAGVYSSRFFLKITNSYITSVENVDGGLNGRIWTYGNEVFYDSFRNDVTEITVFDLRGVQVYQSFPNDRNSRFTIGTATEGVFIVSFKDKLGNQRVERVYLSK